MTDLATIKFGTDGWRAVIAREYTFANLDRVLTEAVERVTVWGLKNLPGTRVPDGVLPGRIRPRPAL